MNKLKLKHDFTQRLPRELNSSSNSNISKHNKFNSNHNNHNSSNKRLLYLRLRRPIWGTLRPVAEYVSPSFRQ